MHSNGGIYLAPRMAVLSWGACFFVLGFLNVPLGEAARAETSKIEVRSYPLSACKGGTGYIATLAPGAQLKVHAEGAQTLDQVIESIRKRGETPRLAVNAGFFSGSEPVSYFKSAKNRVEHPRNSLRSPRACMEIGSASLVSRVVQSSEEVYQGFRRAEASEIFCAGPRVLDQGKDVVMTQVCREQFSPECRADGSDPGLGATSNLPRSASCVTRSGTIRFFVFNSNTSRCGITLPDLARWMQAEDCVDGLNHDGGASVKFFAEDAQGRVHRSRGMDDGPGRTIPVWITVTDSPGI